MRDALLQQAPCLLHVCAPDHIASVLGEGKVVAKEARGRVLTVLPNVVIVAVTVLQTHLRACIPLHVSCTARGGSHSARPTGVQTRLLGGLEQPLPGMSSCCKGRCSGTAIATLPDDLLQLADNVESPQTGLHTSGLASCGPFLSIAL